MTTMDCIQLLRQRWQRHDTMVCVGLDVDPARLPESLRGHPEALLQFNRAIVDATHDLVCAYKPQIAYYAAAAAEDQLLASIDYIRSNYPDIPVILDAKRGDIGATAEQYAAEAFQRYRAHAVTVNPYMGSDTITPFCRDRQHAAVLLCRTSNPGAAQLQNLDCGGQPLYLHVAELAATQWNTLGNLMLVVGATATEALQEVRQRVGDMPLLVPGIGAQGGELGKVLEAGRSADGYGLIINSARAILYADSGAQFASAARREAKALRDAIRSHR